MNDVNNIEDLADSEECGRSHGILHNDASDDFAIHYNHLSAMAYPQTPPAPPLPHPRATSQPRPISNTRHELLESIEDKQDDIRDARERLVGVRVRLRRKRLEVRATREQVGVKVGFAFDHIKRFLLSQGLELPHDLQEALDEADASRDKLGIQESEFEEAEEKHNLEEWRYTEEETRFIQDLYASLSEDIGKDTCASEASSSSIVLAAHRGTKVNEPRAEQPPALVDNGPTNYRSASLSVGDANTDFADDAPLSRRPHSVPNLIFARSGWTQTRERIDDWLLEALQSSKFHKAQLRKLLPRATSRQEDWLKIVIHHWSSASPTFSAFHTGDTTISGTLSSEQISAKTMQRLFEELPSLDVGEKQSSATPLVEDDHNVNTLEYSEFPGDIKLSEMLDRPSKRVTFDDRSLSAISTSTYPTIVTHASSEKVPSSVSSDNELSISRETTQHVYGPLESKRSLRTVKLRVPNGEVSSPSIVASSGISGQALQDISQNNVTRSDNSSISSDMAFRLVVDVAPTPWYGNARFTAGDYQMLTPRSLPVVPTYNKPLGVPRTGSDLRAARSHTRHPFAPFIRVKAPEPWSLPLLRLTPLPAPTCVDSSRSNKNLHLETIPFVAISDTPARLPGPSVTLGSPSTDLYS